MLKVIRIGLALALTCLASGSGAVEKQATIDGSSLAVIAPTFYGASNLSPQSFIRLFSGAGAAGTTSTFTVTVVGVPSGQVYGSSFTVSVPYLASLQFGMNDLVSRTGATLGSFLSGDSGYAIYLQNPDKESGYQHVVYNANTELFENLSNCHSLLNEQMNSLHKEMVLTNVHTTGGTFKSGVNFPSTIIIHNRANSATTYKLSVYNAGGISSVGSTSTNSGKLTCQITSQSVPANSSVSIPFSTIESNSACSLDSDENYANVVISNNASGAIYAEVTHLVHVLEYGGDSNLTDVCAVNQVATQIVQAAPSTPTSYCGSANAFGYSGAYIISIAPDGKVYGSATVSDGSGSFYSGTSSGSSFTAYNSYGYAITGSIVNGLITGTAYSQYGPISFSASTNACS